MWRGPKKPAGAETPPPSAQEKTIAQYTRETAPTELTRITILFDSGATAQAVVKDLSLFRNESGTVKGGSWRAAPDFPTLNYVDFNRVSSIITDAVYPDPDDDEDELEEDDDEDSDLEEQFPMREKMQ